MLYVLIWKRYKRGSISSFLYYGYGTYKQLLWLPIKFFLTICRILLTCSFLQCCEPDEFSFVDIYQLLSLHTLSSNLAIE